MVNLKRSRNYFCVKRVLLLLGLCMPLCSSNSNDFEWKINSIIEKKISSLSLKKIILKIESGKLTLNKISATNLVKIILRENEQVSMPLLSSLLVYLCLNNIPINKHEIFLYALKVASPRVIEYLIKVEIYNSLFLKGKIVSNIFSMLTFSRLLEEVSTTSLLITPEKRYFAKISGFNFILEVIESANFNHLMEFLIKSIKTPIIGYYFSKEVNNNSKFNFEQGFDFLYPFSKRQKLFQLIANSYILDIMHNIILKVSDFIVLISRVGILLKTINLLILAKYSKGIVEKNYLSELLTDSRKKEEIESIGRILIKNGSKVNVNIWIKKVIDKKLGLIELTKTTPLLVAVSLGLSNDFIDELIIYSEANIYAKELTMRDRVIDNIPIYMSSSQIYNATCPKLDIKSILELAQNNSVLKSHLKKLLESPLIYNYFLLYNLIK